MNEPMQALLSEFAGDALAHAASAPHVLRRRCAGGRIAGRYRNAIRGKLCV